MKWERCGSGILLVLLTVILAACGGVSRSALIVSFGEGYAA